jgi:hypothetical protein
MKYSLHSRTMSIIHLAWDPRYVAIITAKQFLLFAYFLPREPIYRAFT